MNQPTLVCVTGLPGSGATEFSRALAAEEQAVLISAEAIHEHLVAATTHSPNATVVTSTVGYLAELLLKQGFSVIVDANLSQTAGREYLYQIALSVNATPVLAWTHGSSTTAIERLSSRMAPGEAEQLIHEASLAQQYPASTEPHISVDTNHVLPLQIADFRHSLRSHGARLQHRQPDSTWLYLMLGLPGSGKTTAARAIAHTTGAIRLSSDDFRLRLFTKPTFSQAEHDTLYALLDYCTWSLLSQQVSCIYDANLNRRTHRQDKYDISKQTGASTRLLWVQTNTSLAKQRRVTESHDLLLPPNETPEAMFDRITDIFQAPDANEPYTILDGTQISDEYVISQLKAA